LHGLVGFLHGPSPEMMRSIHSVKSTQNKRIARSRVGFQRSLMKTFLIIAPFIAIAVAPAFAALNVFTDKNRL
jgi:hypothetical protein